MKNWVMIVCVNWPPTCIVALMLPLLMASKTMSSPMNTFLGEMCSYVVNNSCWNVMCYIAPESTIHVRNTIRF
jgi:hypothetical protein